MRFSQVRLLVDDPAAAFRFYRDVLGLTVSWGEEGEPYASFTAGEATVAIAARSIQETASALGPTGDGVLVVLEVDDLDATADELRRRGAVLEVEPVDRPDWGIRLLELRDPDGHLIEIVESIPMDAS